MFRLKNFKIQSLEAPTSATVTTKVTKKNTNIFGRHVVITLMFINQAYFRNYDGIMNSLSYKHCNCK